MALTWPLVGRGSELSEAAAMMGNPRAAGLVVRGPPGIGKTRLVTEVLARAPQARFCVYRATATRAAATIPFAALSHLLPDPEQQGSNLLRRTSRSLSANAGPRRVVVAIDDAHLLDDASAALVHHLVTASSAFVVATVRDSEPAPDAVRSCGRDGSAGELALGPLSDDEVHAAVCCALDGPVCGSVVHRLSTLSAGNAQLLTELVTTALAEGRLIRRAGLWRLRGRWTSGHTLPELVRDRLDRLAPEVYAAAQLLALGEPVGAAEAEAMLPAEVLDALEREGLLAAINSGRRRQIRLVHPLHADALCAVVTPLRARAAYRTLADALEATGARRRGDVLRLAVYRSEAGQSVDPELLLEAAQQDEALFDRGVSERLARTAEEAGGGLRARLVRVEALRWMGRAEEADALLRDAPLEGADSEQRSRVAAVRASTLLVGLNRPAEAERVLAEAREHLLEQAGADPDAVQAERTKLDVLAAEFRFNTGRIRDAVDMSERALAGDHRAVRTRCSAAAVATVSLTWSGRPDRAVAVAQRAWECSEQEPGELGAAMENLLSLTHGLAHLYAGRFDTAQALADLGYRRALERRAEALEGQSALALGHVALLRGRVATAGRWLREASVLIERHAPAMGRFGTAYALASAGEATALGGDPVEADAAGARADDLLTAGALLCNRGRVRVWAAAARGETATAARLALADADALASAGAALFEAMSCHDAVRLGAAELVGARLARLAAAAEGELVGLYARHATALAADDGAGLDTVAREFAALGAVLLAAEAAAQASQAHRRAGSDAAATTAAHRSRELASRCQGARTPALALAGEPTPLTPREREVAGLAAHELSNRDIAARLLVSERTIHNHLHRAYTKLGISTRRQLRSVLTQ
jgi:DNA-binding NarL/FixJ family response regulator